MGPIPVPAWPGTRSAGLQGGASPGRQGLATLLLEGGSRVVLVQFFLSRKPGSLPRWLRMPPDTKSRGAMGGVTEFEHVRLPGGGGTVVNRTCSEPKATAWRPCGWCGPSVAGGAVRNGTVGVGETTMCAGRHQAVFQPFQICQCPQASAFLIFDRGAFWNSAADESPLSGYLDRRGSAREIRPGREEAVVLLRTQACRCRDSAEGRA